MLKYLRNPELITASLEEDLVMLDIEQGKYFSLNPVAARIWELLENPSTNQDLCVVLENEFDVSSEQCAKEVKVLLAELLEMKLIKTI